MTTIRHAGDPAGDEGRDRRHYEPLSQAVDWIVSLLLVLTGGVLLYGGAVLAWAVDRAAIARGVASGQITSDVLSPAELVEVTQALGWGGGIGIAITGGLFVVAGIAFHRIEGRSRRQFEETGTATPNIVGNAILGAFVTVLTSFLVLSPIVGGGVAGYLQRTGDGNGTKAGAVSGLFAALPVVVIFAVILSAVSIGSPQLAALVGFVFVVAIATIIALSALGGYLGAALAASQR